MKTNEYFVTNEISVNYYFAKKLEDNGKGGDEHQDMMIAPSMQGTGLSIVFLETNGGPFYVATVDFKGNLIHYADESCSDFICESFVCDMLIAFGFWPDCESADFGIKDFLIELIEQNQE